MFLQRVSGRNQSIRALLREHFAQMPLEYDSEIKLALDVLRMQIQAKDLTLADVHRLLKLQRQLNGSFASLRSLEALTEFELQELGQIRNDFDHYLTEGILEGMVKALTIFPLLRLAGFYRYQK